MPTSVLLSCPITPDDFVAVHRLVCQHYAVTYDKRFELNLKRQDLIASLEEGHENTLRPNSRVTYTLKMTSDKCLVVDVRGPQKCSNRSLETQTFEEAIRGYF